MRPSYQLTNHRVGSVREIWSISWPLMLSLSSTSLMNFADRLYLAHFSISAMNAVTVANACIFVLMAFPLTVCEITNVFVGRFSGRADYANVGKPVWQILWLAIFSAPLLMLISRLIAPVIFHPDSQEAVYFVTALDFGPFQLASYGLMGFFLGLGKTRIITLSTILANILNAILAPLFIFGTALTPEMGVKGAGLAIGLAQSFHTFLLLSLFLRKKHRKHYETGPCTFDVGLIRDMLFVGVPAGIGRAVEALAHSIFFCMIALAGSIELTSATIAQSFYMLAIFCVHGISKAVTAIISNLVGAKAFSLIPKAIKSALKVHVVLFVILLSICTFGAEHILGQTLKGVDRALLDNPQFISTVKITLTCMCIFFLLKGFSWIMIGHLTALGDTKFVMYVNATMHWLAYIIPVYFIVNYLGGGAVAGWGIIALNSLLVFTIFWSRSNSRVTTSLQSLTSHAS